MKANYLILLVLFISCNQAQKTPNEDNNKSHQSKNLAETWIDAFENNDFKNLHQIISQDVIVYGFGGVDSMSFDEVLDKMHGSADRKNHSPFTDKKWLPLPQHDNIFNSEGILFWGTANLNYKDGTQVSFPVHIVTLVENNQIKKMRFYYDVIGN